MLVLSMNSKRQRRPSVRLGEVGDVPAASACWFSQTTREFLTQRSWEDDLIPALELGSDDPSSSCNEIQPEFADDKIQPYASTSNDLQNIENTNPNSSKPRLDCGFGTINWNTRRPRGRNMIGTGVVNAPRCSTQCPEAETRDGSEFSEREQSRGSNARDNSYPQNVSGDIARDPNRNNVRRWLEELGFGEYADLFEMHEVDEEALPLLTFTDLKEMGVFAVGHRRKLYNAIRQLKCNP